MLTAIIEALTLATGLVMIYWLSLVLWAAQ